MIQVLESAVYIRSLYEQIILIPAYTAYLSAGFTQAKLHHEVNRECTNTTGTEREAHSSQVLSSFL